MNKLQILTLFLLLPGCTSIVHDGGNSQPTEGTVRVVMPPFLNATDHEHAGEALTQLTGSTLLEFGTPLYQTEELLSKAPEGMGAKEEARYLQVARESKAIYVLIGTVHEYRYKSDLNGNPAVGITLRLVNAADGSTLWQGTSSKVGRGNASLTATAQMTVRDLVSRIPLIVKRSNVRKK